MKNSNDNIGNRTRYLPTRGAVPEPNALPYAPSRCLGHALGPRPTKYRDATKSYYSGCFVYQLTILPREVLNIIPLYMGKKLII